MPRFLFVLLLAAAGFTSPVSSQSESALRSRKPSPPLKTGVSPLDGLVYIWIPAAVFQMGCPASLQCNEIAKPAHTVRFQTGFWIGQTLVTQQAYTKVIGSNPSLIRNASDLWAGWTPAYLEYFQWKRPDTGPVNPERLPVENVNWHQARAYCQKIGMDLPTEAEWEYVAQLGGPVPANVKTQAASLARTHEVTHFPPNRLGLYDILAPQIGEWVGDYFATYSPNSADDPHGPKEGEFRVLRGGPGSQAYPAATASRRDPYERFYNLPEIHTEMYTFRCATSSTDIPGAR